MPRTLHIRHFDFHLPKLSPSEFANLEFVIWGIVVLALVVLLSLKFPLGTNAAGWDEGGYLAKLDH